MDKFAYPEEFPEDASKYISDTEQEEETSKLRKTFPNAVFIWGMPKVPAGSDKVAKLTQVALKKFGHKEHGGTFDFELEIEDVDFDKTGETPGCAILTFKKAKEAKSLCEVLNGYQFDKKHTMRAIMMDEYDNILETPDKLAEKPLKKPVYTEDSQDWMCDKQAREQVLLRYESETEVLWNDVMESTLAPFYCGDAQKARGKVWCDWKVEFSPLGNYVATVHKPGICLWGGNDMSEKLRVEHKTEIRRDRTIDFSPLEKYMLTWNGCLASAGDPDSIRIWNLKTGDMIKNFKTPPRTPHDPTGDPIAFPHFLWSPDAKYTAMCTDKGIYVYEIDAVKQTCVLTTKPGEDEPSAIKFGNGIGHFSFSPADNILGVWSPKSDNIPPRLTIMDVESREELRTAAKGQDVSAEMKWQSKGEYLSLIMSKLTKLGSEKPPQSIEVFRVKEKGCPVENLEMKQPIKGFFWEPKGDRFAVITEHETAGKNKLLFYSMSNEKCVEVANFDLPGKNWTQLDWAPDGQYFTIISQPEGEILFGRLSVEQSQLELLNKEEHYNISHVAWDPSSRYVMTAVCCDMNKTFSSNEQDAGYCVWTFQGRRIIGANVEKLYQVQWRPHPVKYFDESEEKLIRKNLKTQFTRKYDNFDEKKKEERRKELKAESDRAVNGFLDICMKLDDEWEVDAPPGWNRAWQQFKEDHAFSEKYEIIEEVIERKEEVMEN